MASDEEKLKAKGKKTMSQIRKIKKQIRLSKQTNQIRNNKNNQFNRTIEFVNFLAAQENKDRKWIKEFLDELYPIALKTSKEQNISLDEAGLSYLNNLFE